jgi:hypothetical protein
MALKKATKAAGVKKPGRPASGLSAAEIRALRRLLDEAAIREVLEVYFHCVDSRTLGGLRAVFTDDAKYDFSGGLVRYIGWKGAANGLDATLKGGSISSSNHYTTSTRIKVSGDTATSDTHAMVVLMSERGNGAAGTAITRGLRYKDQWVRTARGWRIVHRQHNRTWTYESLAVRPAAPAGGRKRPGIR